MPPSSELVYLKRKRPAPLAIDQQSLVLFRLGEMCNYRCPMCPVTGLRERFFHSVEDLLDRIDYLADLGFRGLVLTGGEPTIHPGFRVAVERIYQYKMDWKINTNASGFAAGELSEFCFDRGLQHAIVSLHSHVPSVSARIFGTKEQEHHLTLRGIEALLVCGVEVMLNCVLTRYNLHHLAEFVAFVAAHFGSDCDLKIAFPNDSGVGKFWEGVDLRYSEVKPFIGEAQQAADELGLALHFEGIPNCVHGNPEPRNFGRSQFGETHYLDERSGRVLRQINQLEQQAAHFSPSCAKCRAANVCSGVTAAYCQQNGFDELKPIPS